MQSKNAVFSLNSLLINLLPFSRLKNAIAINNVANICHIIQLNEEISVCKFLCITQETVDSLRPVITFTKSR